MYREQGFSGHRYLYGFLQRNDAHEGECDAPSQLSIKPGFVGKPHTGILMEAFCSVATQTPTTNPLFPKIRVCIDGAP